MLTDLRAEKASRCSRGDVGSAVNLCSLCPILSGSVSPSVMLWMRCDCQLTPVLHNHLKVKVVMTH